MAADDISLDPGPAAAAGAYRVLARKYRPQSFMDLIGQEPMVRTLRNAFATGRIHQAYIFTGVRGVGKTTTARILARALNYETETIRQPAIDMPEPGLHCQAIMESRHVDVIEMDAASNTSIDNVREIIEAARYKPVSARTKVYIIDEVHMLSKAAFNGLLKTLEEPPPHVKFLFATTEIRKVPVTVLSRCQRFDLRRIEMPAMIAYLDRIAEAEAVRVEPEAMALIARASEGSMRDALSLLDQVIAHGGGAVRAEEVRAALGLADRARVIDLFEALMRGEIAAALEEFASQYDSGADPAAIITDLAEFVHVVTRLKLVPDAARDPALSETERRRGGEFAKALPIRALTMAWQILLKGIGEVQAAARPRIAAEMVLVRLAYAAELPSPAEVIRELKGGAAASATSRAPVPSAGEPRGMAPQQQAGATPPRLVSDRGAMRVEAPAHAEPLARAEATLPAPALPGSLPEIVALAERHRDIRLQTALERDIRVVAFEPGRIEIALLPAAEADLPNRLAKALLDWTGTRWGISIAREPAPDSRVPTLREAREAERQAGRAGVQNNPAVRAVLDRFPGAEITAVREPAAADHLAAPDDAPAGEDAATFTEDDL
ncbi:DNA polymerase III subunit gamma/tau [Rhabdaerophilum calidifontis]|uniref:DNA polymerase III subunit gamma/tau n=1 Tax=Rhabdaerophilum calidifontis TaxID=2604328 RepID=UPI001239CE69|nr:DNA polymerase III subunit gamma/tau [Rhabdaerophilum calidifontis]